MTENRIRSWINEYGEDGAYISFSGGKDSTVLLDIVRRNYPNVVGVFVDTGLEYPEIREFVKTFDNIEWLKPKKTFKQVINEYGYPMISKEVSQKVSTARSCPGGVCAARFNENNEHDKKYGARYSLVKWRWLLEAPFKIDSRCCNIMKKEPTKTFEKKNDKKPITAIMAYESLVRKSSWIRHGCNSFDSTRPISNPMSFWTENDVLQYIVENDLEICSVYGDIIKDGDRYRTTGCNRTGCMFCGFGCHLEKPGEGRFLKMKETHPKQYNYIMKPTEDGGLNYKFVLDWINKHGNFHIEY